MPVPPLPLMTRLTPVGDGLYVAETLTETKQLLLLLPLL